MRSSTTLCALFWLFFSSSFVIGVLLVCAALAPNSSAFPTARAAVRAGSTRADFHFPAVGRQHNQRRRQTFSTAKSISTRSLSTGTHLTHTGTAPYRFVMRDIVNTTAADTHKHVKGMLCCPPRLHVCVRRTSCSQKPSGDSSACNSRADGSIMPFIGRFFDLYGWTCVMWVIADEHAHLPLALGRPEPHILLFRRPLGTDPVFALLTSLCTHSSPRIPLSVSVYTAEKRVGAVFFELCSNARARPASGGVLDFPSSCTGNFEPCLGPRYPLHEAMSAIKVGQNMSMSEDKACPCKMTVH